MKFIRENIEEVRCNIVEGKGGNSHFIEGIFMQSDIKNQNGRIYPFSTLKNEAKRYQKEFIENKRAFGELGHPEGPQINLDRVSHLIVELKEDGKNFFGKAKIMDTPVGNIVKSFISEGAKLGVSTRGIGSVKNVNGIQEVQDDFVLSTVDIVADPSGPNCFVDGIMENVEWIYDENYGFKAMELVERQKKELKKNYKKISMQQRIDMFESFLKTL